MPKDNEHIRYKYDREVQDIFDANYQDLGGGDLKFLPINALEALKDWCEEEIQSYEEI